jgi:hypothetical protein
VGVLADRTVTLIDGQIQSASETALSAPQV